MGPAILLMVHSFNHPRTTVQAFAELDREDRPSDED